jgi:hypothetical protein
MYPYPHREVMRENESRFPGHQGQQQQQQIRSDAPPFSPRANNQMQTQHQNSNHQEANGWERHQQAQSSRAEHDEQQRHAARVRNAAYLQQQQQELLLRQQAAQQPRFEQSQLQQQQSSFAHRHEEPPQAQQQQTTSGYMPFAPQQADPSAAYQGLLHSFDNNHISAHHHHSALRRASPTADSPVSINANISGNTTVSGGNNNHSSGSSVGSIRKKNYQSELFESIDTPFVDTIPSGHNNLPSGLSSTHTTVPSSVQTMSSHEWDALTDYNRF